MEAEAKVSLDASGYEEGIERVKKSDREAAATARESYSVIRESAAQAFSAMTSGAEKVKNSSDRLTATLVDGAEKVRRAQRAMAEETARAGRGTGDESRQYQERLRAMDFAERDRTTKQRLEDRQARQQAAREEAEHVRQEAERAQRTSDNLRERGQRVAREGTARGFRESPIADLLNKYEPREEGIEREHGNGLTPQMRQMMRMHSGRAIMDSVLAGASPMRAAEMEGPRIAESLGIGLGPTLAISAAVAGVAKLTEGYMEARTALKEFREAGSFVNGSATTSGEYEKEIEQVTKARDELRTKTSGFSSTAAEALFNVVKHPLRNPFGGQETDEAKDRAIAEAVASGKVKDLQSQKVDVMARENTIRENAARLGEHAVRIAEIELQTRREIQAAQNRASLVSELSPDAEVEQIKRAGAERKRQAEFDLESHRQQIALQQKVSRIENPSGDFDHDAARQFSRVKSVAKLNAELSQALADLQRTKDANGNTEEPQRRVSDVVNRMQSELFTRKESSRVLREQADIQALQLTGQTTAASNAQALLALEGQITAAREAGQSAAATTLQNMKDQIAAAGNLQNFLHPERGQADRAGRTQHEQQQRTYDLAGGGYNPRRDVNGDIVAVVDPMTGKYRSTTPQERTAERAARETGPYARESKIRDAFENASTFGARFGRGEDHVDHVDREYHARTILGGENNFGSRARELLLMKGDREDAISGATTAWPAKAAEFGQFREGRQRWIEKVSGDNRSKAQRESDGSFEQRFGKGGKSESGALDALGITLPWEEKPSRDVPYRPTENIAEQNRPSAPTPFEPASKLAGALEALVPQLAALVAAAGRIGVA